MTDEKPKQKYELKEITTETGIVISENDKAMTDQEGIVKILNGIDLILEKIK